MRKNEVLGKIVCGGLVPIVVDERLPALECIGEAVEAGFEAVEVSCRHPRAAGLIKEAKEKFGHLAVGAASLIEDGVFRDFIVSTGHPVPSIDEAVGAGADFLVSLLPFREATYSKYRGSHVLIPGVSTPGEAHQALDWGANLVKFSNPSLFGGPAFFKGIDAATHRGFPFFVTGGMRPENIPDYIEANVLVFGSGFEIILGAEFTEMVRRFERTRLQGALQAYVKAIDSSRQRFQPGVPFSSRDPVAIAAAGGRCLNAAREG